MATVASRAATRAVIAAVLVNYAGAADTIACVSSLRAADPRPDVIVIVDNASPDDSVAALTQWLQRGIPFRVIEAGTPGADDAAFIANGPGGRVVLVRSAANDGFGPGVNIGWRVAALAAALEYVLLINNDARVDPEFLEPLLCELADAGVGAAAPTILHADGNGVWYAGGEFRWWQCRGAHGTVIPVAARDVTFCTGCAVLVRASAMVSVGGMPEPYFLYYEDVEFSVRLAKAGWRLRYAPDAIARHTVGSSAGQRRERSVIAYVSARNRFWLARRNLPPGRRLLAMLNVLADEAGRAAGALGRGRMRVSAAIARGVVSGLAGTPARGNPEGRGA